jgi:hypothetical protein
VRLGQPTSTTVILFEIPETSQAAWEFTKVALALIQSIIIASNMDKKYISRSIAVPNLRNPRQSNDRPNQHRQSGNQTGFV